MIIKRKKKRIENISNEKTLKPTVETEQGVLDEACHQQEQSSCGSGKHWLQNLMKLMKLLLLALPSVSVQS